MLNANIPGLGVRLSEVGLDTVYPGATQKCEIRCRLSSKEALRRVPVGWQRTAQSEAAGSKRPSLICGIGVEEERLIVEGPVVRGLVPDVLLRLRNRPQRVARTNDSLTAPRIPRNAEGRLGSDQPTVIRLARLHQLGVHGALQGTRVEQVPNPRWAKYRLKTG